MKKVRIIFILNSEIEDASMYKKKFETLKNDLDDCLPIGGKIEKIDCRIIDIKKMPEEAERLNIKSTPAIIVGNLKILGVGNLQAIVNTIKEYAG